MIGGFGYEAASVYRRALWMLESVQTHIRRAALPLNMENALGMCASTGRCLDTHGRHDSTASSGVLRMYRLDFGLRDGWTQGQPVIAL
jgi:hypothetical protein